MRMCLTRITTVAQTAGRTVMMVSHMTVALPPTGHDTDGASDRDRSGVRAWARRRGLGGSPPPPLPL
jgi:hypothetical protein